MQSGLQVSELPMDLLPRHAHPGGNAVSDAVLTQARAKRDDLLLDEEIDRRLDILFSAKDVGPEAREHLKGILKHYAKNPHPFRACMKDNMKRFGPGRTEKVCATLKDMIRGTTKWRHGGHGHVAASEVTEEVEQILLSLPEDALDKIVMEVSNAR
jgi:hypothetical protein